MNHDSITRFAAIAITALLLVTSVAAGQAKQPEAAAGQTITGSGCVEAGVEAGCLVLKDSRTGTLFNLFFKGTLPAIGTAIRFAGRVHDGPTTCQQGTAVDVTKFTPIKMSCTASSGRKKM
jgi:hypothetical protein